MNDTLSKKIEATALEVRRKCLDIAFGMSPKATHFGGALSTVDILATLYFEVMNYDVSNPTWENRDRFFLSKGHSVMGYYATLAKAGFITDEELFTYGQNETFLPGHPVINKEKGIESTNGSLGMGLSVGIGNAIAAKRKNLTFRSYVLMGDGECNEGSVWEAAMAAPHFKLDNLTAIIDRNRFQQTGTGADIMDIGDLREKFSSFGWHALEINGHNVTDILKALNEDSRGKPKAIVAQTIKGKGFSFSEGNNAWHHAVLTKKLYSLGLTECGGDPNADK
jgi:transketolase